MTRSTPPVLLDTNVASFLLAARAQAALYEQHLRNRRALIAFQTEAELLAGADLRGWGSTRRQALARFLKATQVVYPTAHTSRTYGHLRAALTKAGTPLETADLWIAATALVGDLTLLAHDAAFRQVSGLRLICHAPS